MILENSKYLLSGYVGVRDGGKGGGGRKREKKRIKNKKEGKQILGSHCYQNLLFACVIVIFLQAI